MSVLIQFDHNYNTNDDLSHNVGKCVVGIDGYVGNSNVSPSYKTFSIFLFSAFIVYALLTYFWMWKRRNAPLLRKRGDFGLIFVSALGGIFTHIIFLREYLGRDSFPCIAMFWVAVLASPLLIGPSMVRLIIFRNKAVFYQQMKTIAFDVYLASKDQRNLRNLRLAVSDPNSFLLAIQALNIQSFVPLGVGARMSMQARAQRSQSLGLTPELKKQAEFGRGTLAAVSVESVNTGYYTSSAFATLLLLLFILPFAIYGVVITALTPYYHNFECMGCELTILDILMPGAGFVVTLLVVAGISQRIYGAPDPFSISKELLAIIAVSSMFGALTIILLLTDPGEYGRHGHFSWHFFISMMLYIVQTIQCLVPTLRTYRAIPIRTDSDSGELDLKALLNDPTGVVLFQEHMATEFNVESLRFYLEAEKWKSSYDNLDQAQVCKRAYEIFRTFIERGSYMECNISDEVRRAMEKEVSWVQAHGWRSVPKTLFDKPMAEVWRLMTMDSFPRFLKSKIYKEWADSAIARSSQKSMPGLQKKNSRFNMFVSGIVSPPASGSDAKTKEKESDKKKKDGVVNKYAMAAQKGNPYVQMKDNDKEDDGSKVRLPIQNEQLSMNMDVIANMKPKKSENEPIF